MKKKFTLIKGCRDGREQSNSEAQCKAKGQRVAWSSLSEEELGRPGAVLLGWLIRTANDRGQRLSDVANELGVTYGYVAQLRAGMRRIEHISVQFARSCARYLGVPVIAVKIAAGQIQLEDFALPQEGREQELDRALYCIRDDTNWGCWLPANILRVDAAFKQFVVKCYEEATGRRILSRPDLPHLLRELRTAVTGDDLERFKREFEATELRSK